MRASQYILVRHGTLRIVDYPRDGVYSLLDFESQSQAYRYLQRFARNPRAMDRLAELLEHQEEAEEDEDDEGEEADDAYAGRSRPAHSLVKRRDILAEIAELIANQELGVAEELHRTNPPTTLDKKEEPAPQEQPATPKQEKKLTWIEIQVVDDVTGKPVNWVRLVVKTPDGNESYQTTNSEGLVRMEDLDPGKCDVSCELKNPKMEEVLAFVKMGDGAAGQNGNPSNGNGQSAKPGTMLIAKIEKHKVNKGETLDGLAKKAGMSWKDLAKFNWNTDSPDEINKHLRDDVGCTKKTKDGLNYVFDNSDKPGIVLIPKKWEEMGLATGSRHVVRVKKTKRFFIRLENDLKLRIPEAKYEATLADGREITGQLGVGGVDAIEDPPEGEVGVRFPDLDDIEAKSVAASARKAFDDRDPKEIHRFFRYAKETVKLAIAAYDKYFNDYRGKGLKNDIEQEFSSDEEAIGLFDIYYLSTEQQETEEEQFDPLPAFEIQGADGSTRGEENSNG